MAKVGPYRNPKVFVSLLVGFGGNEIREYVEKRLHLILHGGESTLEPLVLRIHVDHVPKEGFSLFHALGIVDPRAQHVDIFIVPPDRLFLSEQTGIEWTYREVLSYSKNHFGVK